MIKRFEGCHNKGQGGRFYVYPDPLSGGPPYTVGWGSTYRKDGTPFKMGESLTQQECDDLLAYQVKANYWDVIKRHIPYWSEMNDNQRSALTSFSYNLGARAYGSSGFQTFTRVLKHKEWEKVPSALMLYVNPGSNVEEGLRRRRRAEGELWAKSIDT